MKLVLCDRNVGLVAQWMRAFKPYKREVTLVHGNILELKAGRQAALVSPANSHGWMNGGIDLAYREFFGAWIEKSAMEACSSATPQNRLEVGEAVIIPTHHKQVPWLILAPTMAVPTPGIPAENVYKAFKAALVLARAANLNKVLCPGLGIGTGRVSFPEAADQMARAYAECRDTPEEGEDHEQSPESSSDGSPTGPVQGDGGGDPF